MMAEAGLRQGAYSVRAALYHEEEKAPAVVRGDDFIVPGSNESLDWFRGVAQQRAEVKPKGRLERGTRER